MVLHVITSKLQSDVAALLPSRPNKPSEYRHQGRRRFRGRKRYYQSIQTKPQDFLPDLSPEHWYDFWHYHADWPGYGNLGWKHRKAHIRAHCLVFANFVRLLADYSQPYQLWLYLDVEDSGQDAAYFHTPNPNGDGDHFPATLPNVQRGIPALEQYLSEILMVPIRAGIEKWPSGSMFYVYFPVHGETMACTWRNDGMRLPTRSTL